MKETQLETALRMSRSGDDQCSGGKVEGNDLVASRIRDQEVFTTQIAPAWHQRKSFDGPVAPARSGRVIARTSDGGTPARVDYSLTAGGHKLVPEMERLCRWGSKHFGIVPTLQRPKKSRMSASRSIS